MRHLFRYREAKIGSAAPPRWKGQATVEFALIALIVLGLIYGIIEVSRLIYINAAVDNGAREGVRYASLNPPGTSRYSDSALRSAVLSKMTLVDPAAVSITLQTGTRCDFCPITATVGYQWTTLVPILNLGSINLNATSVRLIENSR
jgi:Flp pilus assembly protein TadG